MVWIVSKQMISQVTDEFSFIRLNSWVSIILRERQVELNGYFVFEKKIKYITVRNGYSRLLQ